MEISRSKDVVTAFLSCSVRARDWPLVDALAQKVLAPQGFRCLTVGRNVSLAEQSDDAIRRLMSASECLIGVATERLTATDRDFPSQTLSIATSYLLQETSMAFQANLPFLMFKAKNVTLQCVTNRNLWIEIGSDLNEKGQVKFHAKRDLLLTSLRDLKAKALERRAAQTAEQWKNSIGWLSTLVIGGVGLTKGIDLLTRPACFGEFYYRDPECGPCDYRDRCKVEKMERQANS